MNLADNLKKIRKENNLSQEQLAEKLGVSRQSVSKWESNQAYPEMDKVLQLCKMFNLNVDELLNQNIKEINEKKESKNNINKYIDDFLGFITKTIDMFSSMKFKGKIKCLIEQFFIGILLLIIFFVLGTVLAIITSNILDILPYNLYAFIFDVLKGLYMLVTIIAGMVIFLHIFKVRYLDYYIVVKSDKEEITSTEEDKITKKEKIYLERKEKIIIRDPNHSGYKFIKGLLKCIVFIIKICATCIIFLGLFPLMFLVISLVISFLFVKTGILFIGIFLGIISLIVINLLVLYILYSFIFSKKVNKNKIAFIFITSIIIFSSSIGISLIGVKGFNYIENLNSKYYEKDETIIKMNNDLLFNTHYYEIEYIENDSNDVKIVCSHSKYYKCDINVYNNVIYTNIYSNNNMLDILKNIIVDINNKEIIDYSNNKIAVYTSKENINRLIQNLENYIIESQKNEINEQIDYYIEEINSLNEILDEKDNRIYELEEEISKFQNNYE